MKYIFCFLCLYLLSFVSSAQNCNCDDNFTFLVEKIKKNYIGYPDKVNESNQLQFATFTDSLHHIASKSNAYECIGIMREWLDFFKDKHISFGMDFSKLSPDTVRTFFSKEEKTNWIERDFKSYLLQNKDFLDSIEGIWSYGIYEMGIVKDPYAKDTEFTGFIIKADSSRWMPQQIKLKIRKTAGKYSIVYFRGGDHSIQYPDINVGKNLLDFGFFGKWKRGEKPIKPNETAPFSEMDLMASFKILDQQTILLTLPSFDVKYKNRIDSLILKNEHVLSNARHLIIDVRDNPGGTTGCFEKLIPYLYTNPIKVDGGIVLSTEDNIRDCYEKDYSNSSASTKRRIIQNNKKLRAHIGEMYPLYKPETIKLSKQLKNPQHISILMNRNTASSGEFFILRVEQSKKVTLFGENSAGAVDYGELAVSHLPCTYFSLVYPVAKSMHSVRRPLDNIGIAPNVRIATTENNWINFVRTYEK